MRFQQHTGPVMAKGVEDTVFYNYNRLVALNEVGGDPGRFGDRRSTKFHAELPRDPAALADARCSPRPPTTPSGARTSGRGSSLLSEIPERWAAAVERWSEHNERHKRDGMPDRNLEYLLYQTLVGAWPIDVERAAAYMHEGRPRGQGPHLLDRPERGLRGGRHGVHRRPSWPTSEFLADLEGFVGPLIEPGRVNSLAQTLIKLTAPGVPDIYQGTELWDMSLVDPDNRRPVDYEMRRRLLAELSQAAPRGDPERMDEGLPKLWVTRQALHLRRRHPQVFGPEGPYEPLQIEGGRAWHVWDSSVAETSRSGPPAGDPTRWRLEGHGRGATSGPLAQRADRGGCGRGTPARGGLLARFPVALLSRR